jgi:hypothetical protein
MADRQSFGHVRMLLIDNYDSALTRAGRSNQRIS